MGTIAKLSGKMKSNHFHGWDINRNSRHSQCSAWPRWYAGFSCGRFGIGIVRETWGWRVMLGPWDACKMTERKS